MSRGNGDTHEGACRRTRDALSDYLEGGLDPPTRQAVFEHLSGCEECAREERELAAMLRLVYERIPRREPSLDIWAELGPKVEAWRAEERLSAMERLRLRAGRLLGNVAAGAILFTHALAVNTEARMRKYLMADPFRLMEET